MGEKCNPTVSAVSGKPSDKTRVLLRMQEQVLTEVMSLNVENCSLFWFSAQEASHQKQAVL